MRRINHCVSNESSVEMIKPNYNYAKTLIEFCAELRTLPKIVSDIHEAAQRRLR